MVWKLDTTVATLVPHTQSCGEAPAAFALVQVHCLQAFHLAASQIMLNNPTQDVKMDPKKLWGK